MYDRWPEGWTDVFHIDRSDLDPAVWIVSINWVRPDWSEASRDLDQLKQWCENFGDEKLRWVESGDGWVGLHRIKSPV